MPDFTNNPIFIDEERLAINAHVFLAEHVLLFPRAIKLRNSCICISQQRKGQTVFVGKFLMRSNIIGAYAQHDNSPFLHLMVGVAERTRFSSAAGRVVFWIEIEDGCSSLKILQMHLAVFHNVIIPYSGKSKIGGRVLFLDYCIAHKSLL